MAQTYLQLQKQITALQSKAEQAKRSELAGVVSRIKDAIEAYGLKADELFGPAAATPKKTTSIKADLVTKAKYADGKGNTWGGIGKRPYWLRDALSAGAMLEDFAGGKAASHGAPEQAVPVEPKVKGKRAKKGAPAKKTSVAKYQDDAGNTWSGRGPQPKWLKDAIADGKPIQDFTV